MTEEKIRNQPHISFRLAHHLFHIHHHGKVIIRRKTAYTFLVHRSSIQHIPVLQSVHISGETLCIGRQQQSSFIKAGVCVKRGFRNACQLCQYGIPGQHILPVLPCTRVLPVIRIDPLHSRSAFFFGSGIQQFLQSTFCLRFIFYSNAHYSAGMPVGSILGMKQARHDILSRVRFHKFHPLAIPLLDIIGISSLSIFLLRSKAEYGFQIRDCPLVVEKNRGRQPFSRKIFYRFLSAKRIDKCPGCIRSVTDTGTINGFFIELHIKLCPTSQMRLRTNAVCILAHAHFFHAYIHCCRHIVTLTGIHGTERCHVHQ